MSTKLMAIIAVVLFAILPVSAQFEDCVWDTLTHDNVCEIISNKGVAVNGYEQAHLTYGKQRAYDGYDVYYRYFDLYEGFSPEVLVDSVHGCFNPVIASMQDDNERKITIAFEADGDIWVGTVHEPDEPWQMVNITNDVGTNMGPSIDYFYYIHMAWVMDRGQDFKIAYANDRDGSFQTEIIEDSNLGFYGSGAAPFIIGIGNEPHIFYRGENDGHFHIHHAYKVHPDSSWIIEYITTPNLDDYRVTACYSIVRDIYLAISGNEGWGMPSHIYYTKCDHNTLQWSTPENVTGDISATSGSIFERPGNEVYIASCGATGNIYDGHIYLSDNLSGSFQTQTLATYQACTQPVLADIIGEYAMLALDAPIDGEGDDHFEIVCLRPDFAISVDERPLPSKVNYLRNYPNPFNLSTLIKYDLQTQSQATLEIYNILGQKVATLCNGSQAAGNHQLIWNAGGLSSGVYFYKLTAGDYIETRKMMLVK